MFEILLRSLGLTKISEKVCQVKTGLEMVGVLLQTLLIHLQRLFVVKKHLISLSQIKEYRRLQLEISFDSFQAWVPLIFDNV